MLDHTYTYISFLRVARHTTRQRRARLGFAARVRARTRADRVQLLGDCIWTFKNIHLARIGNFRCISPPVQQRQNTSVQFAADISLPVRRRFRSRRPRRRPHEVLRQVRERLEPGQRQVHQAIYIYIYIYVYNINIYIYIYIYTRQVHQAFRAHQVGATQVKAKDDRA